MNQYVDYLFEKGVARVGLVAGDSGNAINLEVARELLDAVLAAKSARARVIVLHARGRFFSVGGDLSSIANAEDAESTLLELAELAHRVVTELMRGDAIVVSAVQGTAAGIGFPLAAAADILVMAENARLSLAYAKVGLSPDGGSSLLVHTLGLHRVLRLALLGDLLSAPEAFSIGLAARVVPAEELERAVDDVVAALLGGSGTALGATKRVLRSAAAPFAEALLRTEAETISRLANTSDGQEGMKAFLSKRSPVFGEGALQ